MKKTLLFAILLLSSCSWVSKERALELNVQEDKIDITKSFYVAYPSDGYKRGYFSGKMKKNNKSAKEVSKYFLKFAKKNLGKVSLAQEYKSLEDNFKDANDNGDDYLIVLDIEEWKDASFFVCEYSIQNGRVLDRDAADIIVSVYDVKTQTLLNKQRLVGNGCPFKLFFLIPIGTNSPEGYFKYSLKHWINNI